MTKEKLEEYVAGRYSDQVHWYDGKSARNKKFYYSFQWAVIGLSATLPVLVTTIESDRNWITALLAVVLAIGTAGLTTFKFHENWISYRAIAEALKKERHYYDAGIDSYEAASDVNALFVQRVESLISRENSLWVTVHQQKPEKESKQI